MTVVPWLNETDPFPPVEQALTDNEAAAGLLAVSRTLTPSRLLSAYHLGIFPWYSKGQPVLWWSPDPRMVLAPQQLRISKSLRKTIKQFLQDPRWEIRVDHGFIQTMAACAKVRRQHQEGTWITDSIISAYHHLHTQGFAHSIEVWCDTTLVAGLYGVAIGRMFFGESMFTYQANGSKIALAALCAFLHQHHVPLIDCQQDTAHLTSLGGHLIPRTQFITHLQQAVKHPPIHHWQFDKTILQAWIST